MKTKSKVLVSALVAIVLCVSMIAGATFALFTSESNVNIAVTSGKVDVSATIGSVVTKSFDEEQQTVVEDSVTKYMWENNGYATVDGNTVNLVNITAGDSVSFAINVDNSNTTVAAQYRVGYVVENGYLLASGLDITVGEISGKYKSYLSAWNSNVSSVYNVTIALPNHTDSKLDNLYQGLSTNIAFKVEAVQANAVSAENNTAVTEALPDYSALEAAYVENADSVTVASTFDDIKDSLPGLDTPTTKPVSYVVLAQDLSADGVMCVNNDMTIEGNGYELATTAHRGFVATNGVKLVVNDVVLVATKVYTGPNVSYRGAQFDVNANAEVELNNVTIDMVPGGDNYAFNACGGSSGKLIMRNCNFTAYQGVNIYGHNMEVIVEDCVFNYVNMHNKSYFGGFFSVFYGEGANDITMKISNTKFITQEIGEGCADCMIPVYINTKTYKVDPESLDIEGFRGDIEISNCTIDGEALTDIYAGQTYNTRVPLGSHYVRGN